VKMAPPSARCTRRRVPRRRQGDEQALLGLLRLNQCESHTAPDAPAHHFVPLLVRIDAPRPITISETIDVKKTPAQRKLALTVPDGVVDVGLLMLEITPDQIPRHRTNTHQSTGPRSDESTHGRHGVLEVPGVVMESARSHSARSTLKGRRTDPSRHVNATASQKFRSQSRFAVVRDVGCSIAPRPDAIRPLDHWRGREGALSS